MLKTRREYLMDDDFFLNFLRNPGSFSNYLTYDIPWLRNPIQRGWSVLCCTIINCKMESWIKRYFAWKPLRN